MSSRDQWTSRLRRLREEIDALNREILERLERRAELVHEVGEIKDELDLPLHDPEREEEMLHGLIEKSSGHVTEGDLRHVFHAIFGVGLEQQRRRSRRTETKGRGT